VFTKIIIKDVLKGIVYRIPIDPSFHLQRRGASPIHICEFVRRFLQILQMSFFNKNSRKSLLILKKLENFNSLLESESRLSIPQ